MQKPQVLIVGDQAASVGSICGILDPYFSVQSGLLGEARAPSDEMQGLVVVADVRDQNNISALKDLSGSFKGHFRVFVLDRPTRLSIVQAYALGATHVLTAPAKAAKLLAILSNSSIGPDKGADASATNQAAFAAASSIAAVFKAVTEGTPFDLTETIAVGQQITEAIRSEGLSSWLATVRDHHEGTYQHCLLVTGIAVDFSVHLGLGRHDINRLVMAAMFHDIGKAKIPLAVLDKPSKLDAEERALIESHPIIGFEYLKDVPGISDEVLDAVRHHHEYLDGSGYPDKLSGDLVNDIVRILTICDIFGALIERRTYKPTMPRSEAYEILKGMSGKLEKPLVEAFREVALVR